VTVKIESSHGRQFASGTASVAATTSTDEGQTARRRNPYYKTAFCSDYMGPQVSSWCLLQVRTRNTNSSQKFNTLL